MSFNFIRGDFGGFREGFKGGMRRGFGVFGRFSGDRRRGRGGRGAGGFEGGVMGRSRVVIMCDGMGRIEAFLEAELVLDFFLGSLAADKFLGVGVVPPGEADFGGGAVGLWEELRRRK